MDTRQVRLSKQGEEVAEALQLLDAWGTDQVVTDKWIVHRKTTSSGLTKYFIRPTIPATRQDGDGVSGKLVSD